MKSNALEVRGQAEGQKGIKVEVTPGKFWLKSHTNWLDAAVLSDKGGAGQEKPKTSEGLRPSPTPGFLSQQSEVNLSN